METPNQKRKISKLSWKFCYFVFIFLYFAVTLMKITTICTKRWFKQGEGKEEWSGSLFGIYSSGGLYEQESYAWLSNRYCDKSTIEYIPGQCKTFSNLSKGGDFVVILSCIEIIFTVDFIAFTIIFSCCNKTTLCFRLFFSILAALSAFIEFCFMAGLSMVTYSDDCAPEDPSSQSNTCALIGAQLDLFNFFFTLLVSLFFWTFLCLTGCEERLNKDESNEKAHIVKYSSSDVAPTQGSIPTEMRNPKKFEAFDIEYQSVEGTEAVREQN